MIPAKPIPPDLTESLRDALAQALASGALQDTEAAALVTNFLVSGTLDHPVNAPWYDAEPNKTAYWAMWCLSWWVDGNAFNVEDQLVELRRNTPRTHEHRS